MESSQSLVSNLQSAIKNGKKTEAERLAKELASSNHKVVVTLDEVIEELRIVVNVENKLLSGIRFTLSVPANKNIRSLKKQIRELFGFPLENQVWFVNTTPLTDDQMIQKVAAPPHQLFLYLLHGCRKKER